MAESNQGGYPLISSVIMGAAAEEVSAVMWLLVIVSQEFQNRLPRLRSVSALARDVC